MSDALDGFNTHGECWGHRQVEALHSRLTESLTANDQRRVARLLGMIQAIVPTQLPDCKPQTMTALGRLADDVRKLIGDNPDRTTGPKAMQQFGGEADLYERAWDAFDHLRMIFAVNQSPQQPESLALLGLLEQWAATNGLSLLSIAPRAFYIELPGAERPDLVTRPFTRPFWQVFIDENSDDSKDGPIFGLALIVDSATPDCTLRLAPMEGTLATFPMADWSAIEAELQRQLPLVRQAWADFGRRL